MSAREMPVTGENSSRRFVVVLYDRNGTIVTDRTVIRGRYRYAVSDIQDLGKSRGALHPAVWGAVAVGMGDIVVVGGTATISQSAVAWFVAVAVLVISCGVAVHYAVRRPRELRLLADYCGVRITMLRTCDKVEFGQVSRAVQRAVELRRHHEI